MVKSKEKVLWAEYLSGKPVGFVQTQDGLIHPADINGVPLFPTGFHTPDQARNAAKAKILGERFTLFTVGALSGGVFGMPWMERGAFSISERIRKKLNPAGSYEQMKVKV